MNLFDYTPPAGSPPAFVIKHGIPIPSKRETAVKSEWEKPTFRFKDMEIGDCFDVWPHECGNLDLIRTQNFVSGSAATFRKNDSLGRTFTTRQIQGQFVRCWRIK
jgi:hypothetical protein